MPSAKFTHFQFDDFAKALSDERIGKIEALIAKSLNDDATNQKVC